jgi:predicted acylesterase/phospholipase RssA
MFDWFVNVASAKGTVSRIVAILFAKLYPFRFTTGAAFVLYGLAFAIHTKVTLAIVLTAIFLLLIALLYLRAQDLRGNAATDGKRARREPSRMDQIRQKIANLLNDRTGTAVITALAVILAIPLFLLFQDGGWSSTWRWLEAHWYTILLVAVPFLLTVADRPILAAVQKLRPKLPPATLTLVHSSVEFACTAIACLIVAMVAVGAWDDIVRVRGLVAVGLGSLLLGWITGGAIGILANILWFIPGNHNGLCTGLGRPDQSRKTQDNTLVNWLTGKIDEVAGAAGRTTTHLSVGNTRSSRVDLVAITSDLTRGVPLKLPDALTGYRFNPEEFRIFFPPTVVEQLTGAAGVVSERCTIETAQGERYERTLCSFTGSDGASSNSISHVPVIVIARMSMSFPILFSTIPVYYPRAADQEANDSQPIWQRSTLSDGGIVSNFPIHLFDRALSPRPTFAIDLVDKNDEELPEAMSDQFAMSPILGRNRRGLIQNRPMAAALVPDPPPGKLSAFATGILNTARGWMDRSQGTLPGYKERIVGIHLYKARDEGGLNLTMDAKSIDRLANRGLYGMDAFLDRWNPGLGTRSEWHQHRWLRYLILMRSLENFGQEWERGFACDRTPVHTPSVKDMVSLPVPMDTPYPIPPAELARAQGLATLFDQFAGGGTATTGDCDAFGEPIPDGAFDAVRKLQDREPQLLVIPPFK